MPPPLSKFPLARQAFGIAEAAQLGRKKKSLSAWAKELSHDRIAIVQERKRGLYLSPSITLHNGVMLQT